MTIQAGRPCPLCADQKGRSSALQARTLADFTGDEAPLRVTLRSMPVLQCDVGHTYFAKRDFPMWLLQQLVQDEAAKLPAGKASGMLFKRYGCGECGGALAPKDDHRHDFDVPLAFEGSAPFAARLSMPVFKCTACGRAQLRSVEELRKLIPAALVHAFKGAGIKAPG